MGFDSLVIVEVGTYRLHEPGDASVKRGVITATINVIDVDALDPDNYAFSQSVHMAFPDEFHTKIGLVSAPLETIETITVSRFTEDAAGLFYDHQVER